MVKLWKCGTCPKESGSELSSAPTSALRRFAEHRSCTRRLIRSSVLDSRRRPRLVCVQFEACPAVRCTEVRRGEEDSFPQFSWQFLYPAWLTNAKGLNQPQPCAFGRGCVLRFKGGRFGWSVPWEIRNRTSRRNLVSNLALVVLAYASGDQRRGIVAELPLTHAQQASRGNVLISHHLAVKWNDGNPGPDAVAGAYRLSFVQAMATGLAFGMLPLVENGGPAAVSHIRPSVQRMWVSSGLTAWGIAFLFSLLLVGVLGHLVYERWRFRKAALTISRAVGKTQSELGIRKTIEDILDATVDLFSARRIVLVMTDAKGGRSSLWETRGTDAGHTSKVEFSQVPTSEAQMYFLAGLGRGWSAIQLRRSAAGEPLHCLVLEDAGKRTCDVPSSCLQEFLAVNDFHTLLGVALSFGKWSGRLLVLDPGGTAVGESELRFLQALIRDVAPAVHSQYLLAHLRSRIQRAERARVARELHDGVIQSLVAVEMRLAALRRMTLTDPEEVFKTLAQAQQDVRHEIFAVRQLMEQIKPIELSSKELLAYLAEIVDKFQRETAISASFVSEFEQVSLAPHVCSELVRIAQEALFNIRKHSLANNVRVLLARAEGYCKLVIEDDGRGFEFSGRFSQDQLDATRKGPRVIKERVRSIGGELVIDSMPGQGARLEISFPQSVYG